MAKAAEAMTWFFLATLGSAGLLIVAAICLIGKGNPYDL